MVPVQTENRVESKPASLFTWSRKLRFERANPVQSLPLRLISKEAGPNFIGEVGIWCLNRPMSMSSNNKSVGKKYGCKLVASFFLEQAPNIITPLSNPAMQYLDNFFIIVLVC